MYDKILRKKYSLAHILFNTFGARRSWPQRKDLEEHEADLDTEVTQPSSLHTRSEYGGGSDAEIMTLAFPTPMVYLTLKIRELESNVQLCLYP